ncbi:MAG: arginine repressor [Planctomycetota bacterium]|nr:arginine repressor [Planctomycetota bacterium]
MQLENIHVMQPAQRRALILDLLRQAPIPTQQELAGQLASFGVTATQTTLSRDLSAIGAVKTSAGYHPPDATLQANAVPAGEDLAGMVVGAQVGATMLVLRTPAAHAHPVAQRIDALDDPEVLGSIAGDDTVFVATSSKAAAERLSRALFPPASSPPEA